MKIDKSNPLERFFTGLSEYVFHTRLGVVDTELVNYVSELLIRFTRVDSQAKVRKADGKPAKEVTSMVAEAEKRLGDAKREVHRHIGDYTLFWSGLYPEALRQLQSKDKTDFFLNYCAQGKKAYLIASNIQADKKSASCDLLHRMSEHFEMCAYGLREIRREWERREEDGTEQPPLLL